MAYLRYKEQARKKLRSEEGRALSPRRMTEVESVFGQMKNNRGFRRFLLRSLEKVSLEVGWLSLAHNLLAEEAYDGRKRPTGRSRMNPLTGLLVCFF
uniref:transposase n=1 Tax=Paenibacillus durus TaxID=44251 RepID=UPI0009E08CAC|nr:transposase [Paenibacillus durus]